MNVSDNYNLSNKSLNLRFNHNSIKEYVKKFRNKVEEKFNNSKMNFDFKISKENNIDSENSLKSLKNTSIYDLKYQNLNKYLQESNKESISINIIKYIKKIAELDQRYLLKLILRPNNDVLLNLNELIKKKIKIDKSSKKKKKKKNSKLSTFITTKQNQTDLMFNSKIYQSSNLKNLVTKKININKNKNVKLKKLYKKIFIKK